MNKSITSCAKYLVGGENWSVFMNACFMLLCLKNWITGKPKTQFLGIPLLHGDDMSEAEVGKTVCLLLHSQTLPYGHLLNTDTSFLRTVFLVPWEKKAHKFSLNSTRFNTDTFYGPISVCIKGV